jgi:hypothetical protein
MLNEVPKEHPTRRASWQHIAAVQRELCPLFPVHNTLIGDYNYSFQVV